MGFLRQILLPHYGGDENDALLALLSEIGLEEIQELVCVKTRASYERRLEQYGKDIEAMRRLVATSVPAETGTTARLRATTARSG